MLNVHSPKAEAIHDLAQRIVVIEKLDRAHDVEQDLRPSTHIQSVDSSRYLSYVVTRLGFP